MTEITMVRSHAYASVDRRPHWTEGRWHSFSWSLTPVITVKLEGR